MHCDVAHGSPLWGEQSATSDSKLLRQEPGVKTSLSDVPISQSLRAATGEGR
jgi:hypothetical protein